MILTGPGTRLRATKGGRRPELIISDLRPGKYFLRVFYPKRTGRGTPYTLLLKQLEALPADEAGNTLNTATPLTSDSKSGRLGDKLNGVLDRNDFYSFDVSAADIDSTLSLNLTGLKANANLFLYSPSGTVLRTSAKAGTNPESISLKLTESGNYRVQVSLIETSKKTSYNLAKALTPPADGGGSFPNNQIPLPQWNPDSNTASNFSERLGDVSNGATDSDDFYKFLVRSSDDGGQLSISLSGLSAGVRLDLYKTTNGTPTFTTFTTPVATSSNGTLNYTIDQTTDETYYIKVSPITAGQRTRYTMTTSLEPPDNVGNELVVVTGDTDPVPDKISVTDPSGVITEARSDTVGGTDVDVFNFEIAAGETQRFVNFALTKTSGTGNVGLQLYKDVSGTPTLLTGDPLTQIAGTLGEGVYFVRVTATAGTKVGYTLNSIAKDTIAIPTLTKDIAAGDTDSNAVNLTDIGGVAYYAAQESGGNFSLWKSTGTLDGTINLGTFGSSPPSDFTTLGGSIFFLVGGDLYKSNGNVNDAVLVQSSSAVNLSTLDINNADGLSPTDNNLGLIGIGNFLYFTAFTAGTSDAGLYRLNTANNAVEEIIAPGAFTFENLTAVGNALYYSAFVDSNAGTELYRIDDATAATVTPTLFNLNTNSGGGDSSDPSQFTVVGTDTLYFVATGDSGAERVWRIKNSDTSGAVTETANSITFTGETFASNISDLTYVSGSGADTLYFVADWTPDSNEFDRELFKYTSASTSTSDTAIVFETGLSDGTYDDGGTTRFLSSAPTNLVAEDGILYFTANKLTNGVNPLGVDNFELFKLTDGGTLTQLSNETDANPSFDNLTGVGGKLFFTLGTGVNTQLWITNDAGNDIEQRQGFDVVQNPTDLTEVGARLFFVAENVDPNTPATGTEVWAVDP
jgi:hypothetical protein